MASHDGSNFSLTWADNSANEIGFKLERRTATFAPNWGEFARVGPNVTSYAAGPGLAGEFEATFYRVRAFNAAGDSGYSNEVSPPRVRITGPPVGSTYDEPATVTVMADAADADGQIARVEFYLNGTLAGTDTTAPYAVTLNALPAGDYNLRARAVDNQGQTDTTPNGAAGFGVFARPSATITSPAGGANFPNAPASIQISATAQVPPTGQSGEFVNRIDFYANGNLIGTVSGSLAAYNLQWGNVAAGAYLLTAVPTTNWLRTGTSNSVNITVGPPPPSAGGLYYYPLPNPIRLLDTRPGELACDVPGTPLAGNATRTQTARTACSTIPANAQAIVGNATVVNADGEGDTGFITLYPNGATRPTVSNLNYVPGQIVPNAFTVGLGGGDGAFNIYASSETHFIVDVTGYYAPPAPAGLYYHPLPAPVRLLDTRAGEPACNNPGAPLTGGVAWTEAARVNCGGMTIPPSALAIVGNATVVNNAPRATGGYITLYAGGVAQPTVSNLNYVAGQVVPNAFTVRLGTDGAFQIYASSATHFIVDIAGYYSQQPTDENGTGLLYHPLASPVRLLDTRPGQPACDAPGAPLVGGATRTASARGMCGGVTIADTAQAIVGNATVVNDTGAAGGFVTVYPSGAGLPTVSNLNYHTGQVVPNAVTVGLGVDGAFNIYATSGINFIVDVTGYYAP